MNLSQKPICMKNALMIDGINVENIVLKIGQKIVVQLRDMLIKSEIFIRWMRIHFGLHFMVESFTGRSVIVLCI